MSGDDSSAETPVSGANRWIINRATESRKLTNKEEDWQLHGLAVASTRTRHGGKGRPNLKRKQFFDSSTTESDEDDECDPDEASSESDSDLSEAEANERDGPVKKPPATRVTLEVASLKKMMDELSKCQDCSGPLDVEIKTTCIASQVKATCKDVNCGCILHSDPPAPTTMHENSNDNYNRNTDYAVNVLYVLGMMSNGDGCTEAAKMLGLLGLPNDTTMEGRSFHIIEERIGPIIRQLTDEILLENLTEEVRLSVDNQSDFDTWQRSIDPTIATAPLPRHPRITCSSDAAWQQKGSGHTHNSPSGHSLMFGHHTRKPLVCTAKSKMCNCCSSFKKRNPNVDVPPHDCCRNHTGSSGQMEPDSCLELIVSLFDNFQCQVGMLCCDDDSSARADCRWSNAVCLANRPPGAVLPMVKKKVGKNKGELQERPDKGELPPHMPEPLFVADPNHRRKQLTGELIALAKTKVQFKMTMTRMDATRIGKNFGYMARSLKDTPPEQCTTKGMAVLEHHFDNHQCCGTWCSRGRETEEQRAATQKHYRCKEKDAKLCCLLQGTLSNYVTFERLSDIAHGVDTNCCEAFNNFVTWFAPKNKVCCGSRSLWNRMCLCVGITSIGYLAYFRRLYKKLGIAMTANVLNFLDVKNKCRTKRLELAKDKENKKKRNKRKHDKLKEHATIARKERSKREGCRTGMNLDDVEAEATPGMPAQTKPKRPTRPASVCPHPFCGKRGHKTTKSKHCLANPDRLKREGMEAACLAAAAAAEEDAANNGEVTYNGDNDNDAANDLAEYESQPFEEFEEDLFYTSGTWSEDDEGNVVLKTGLI